MLEQRLAPGDSIQISTIYKVKIPKDKFTSYGVNTTSYNLIYWYLIPAIHSDSWILQNHLDMDAEYQLYKVGGSKR